MSKSYMAEKRASGSAHQKIIRAIRAGWQPGMTIAEALTKGRRNRRKDGGCRAI